MKNNVCAVIVTYNCSAALARNVELLRPQVGRLLIVDNGSGRESLALLEEIHRYCACEIIYNGANLGIAAALNLGVDYAARNGYEWLTTFDQDSEMPEDFVKCLLQTFEEATPNEMVGMVLPRYVDTSTGVEVPQMNLRAGTLIIGITSGSLTRLDVFRSCGRFEEKLFIDGVDTEFCLRINWMGWRIIESDRAILRHALGHTTSRNLPMGRKLLTSNHSAARRYYMARNRMYLWIKYLVRYPQWTFGDMRRTGWEILTIILMESGKFNKIAFTARGFSDALLGRFGYRAEL